MVDSSSAELSIDDHDTSQSLDIAYLYAEADAFAQLLKDVDALRHDLDSEADQLHNDFSNLMLKSLDSEERDALGRSGTTTTWTEDGVSSSTNNTQATGNIKFERSTTLEDTESSLLFDSREIMRLLIQEFGSLAEPGDEEQVILEADGCMWLGGVIVVGVIHLTTHRLTFHASLLSTTPDMPQPQSVIKSGSALISTAARSLFQRQKRLWIELSHDVLTVYNSSGDEDRIKPRRTILLSNIRKLLTKSPTSFEVQMQGETGIAEFDTPEATSQWRRELEGAVFLDRHRRRESITNSDSENSGIRLSFPLAKILKVVPSDNPQSPLSIHLQPMHEENDSDCLQVRMAPLIPSPTWNRLTEFVDLAKKRSNNDDPQRLIIVDLGPLSFRAAPVVQKYATAASIEGSRIRAALALSDDAEAWIKPARIALKLCWSGHFVVSSQYVGFWYHTFGREDVKYRLPAAIVKSARAISWKRFWSYGLSLRLEGYSDMRFLFKSQELRDEAVLRINFMAGADRSKRSSPTSSTGPSTPTSDMGSFTLLPRSTQDVTSILSPHSRAHAAVAAVGLPYEMVSKLPKAINIEHNFFCFPKKPLHFVCLTIGSRGDVQPYIALGLGLKRLNHRVTIVTHEEYKGWIQGFGLEHKTAGGDPGLLMKLSVDNKMFSPEFFKETIGKFRPWLDELLVDAWEACQGADVLLESPSAMAGVHIAEALHIPYFRTFTMPWSKTSDFPHPMLSPPVDSHILNSISHTLFNEVLWTATSGQINRWRVKHLKVGPTDITNLAQSKIVHIYNFSEAVVPKPLDWGDTTTISGYWFLDNPDKSWSPPDGLHAWLDQAVKDQKPVVYIGFGSITVPRANRVMQRIFKAVLQSGVRAVIAKGWSSRMGDKDDDPEPQIPKECYVVESIPHDWLFPRVDAVLHHGGAGTTGASLRAGVPTLIKPWFGDQFFWASRVQKLGAGLRVPSLRVNDLADALTKATTSRLMKEKAASVGERIRAEDGVHNAIYTIYTYLSRASQDRTLLDKPYGV
ncbi:hypothetical protein E1B28_012449 [Marasmius oreades]|uniref:sterol 3beta-glucosyltransferase n=1 Tax=Marasmius oreades TaxID=181124 RepID=A0A9P7UNZ2_9AGAR|nr:uncharacterized protein E1B28_012449 [Marasmius oreades]KAG7088460.1 hypothetical protein E1B28_012449 [Marasmius oreades]